GIPFHTLKTLTPKSQRQHRTVYVTDKNPTKMDLRIVYILGTIVLLLYVTEARPYLTDMPEAESEELAEEDEINQKLLDTKSAIAPNRIVKRRLDLCPYRAGTVLIILACRKPG
ncbi:hypothetical protein ACJMK2_011971, partial [Sinanodonta woodiana]